MFRFFRPNRLVLFSYQVGPRLASKPRRNRARKEYVMYFKIVPASGGYRAHLYGDNHELVWFTEVYRYREGAANAIQLARAHAATAPLR
jgi:uncharacterized protein YegP (UPF0339 family)